MLNKKSIYAVIGASNNQEKYGYKVFKDLLDAEYKVVPINPTEQKILGEKVYPTLSAVKKNIDTVIFVTQPKVTEKILQEVKTLGIKNVRLQPGSESITAIDFCKKNTIECIYNACIMMQKNNKSS